MSRPIVFMFSGQGSQYFGMGRELFLINPTFRNWMLELNAIFNDITGESILKLLYGNGYEKSEVFDDILYTHPAIFMVEYSLAQVLIERGIYPDYVLGSSLGEFASSAVAGVMSCEDILECVIKQAQMFADHCQKGGMIAVLKSYKLYEEEPILHNNSELASVNYESHFVISGNLSGLAEIEEYMKSKEYIFQRLPVTFAFHSPLIDPAAPSYTYYLKSKTFSSPKMNYISSVKGGVITYVDNNYFWDIARSPIEFQKAVRSLACSEEYIYVDLGPSGTLANFTRYIHGSKKPLNIFPTITPFHCDNKNLEILCQNIH